MATVGFDYQDPRNPLFDYDAEEKAREQFGELEPVSEELAELIEELPF